MTNQAIDPVMFSDLGEAGILCEFHPGPLDLTRQQRIWAVAEALAALPAITETIPGMNNIAVLFDPLKTNAQSLQSRIEALWATPVTAREAGRIIEVPVSYGGEGGADLAEIAARAGMTPQAFAEAHAAGDYTVFALGAQPGFGYLGGLDPRLATPRRTVVHPRVVEGTIIIGGAQTAVQSRTTPSGWHRIGVTDLTFFDPTREKPALLSPGDRVRFTLIEVQA